MSEQRSLLVERAGEIHADNVRETGVCYTAFQGWVLTCCWCDFASRGATKTVALAGMQEHYDQTCGPNIVEVSADVQR